MLTHLPGSVFLNCGLYFSFRTTPCAAALQTAVSSPDPSCSLQGPAVGEQAHCLCHTLARDLALRSHMPCFRFHQAVASTFGHGVHPPEWHQRVGGATLQEPLERSVSSVEHVGVEKINPVLFLPFTEPSEESSSCAQLKARGSHVLQEAVNVA